MAERWSVQETEVEAMLVSAETAREVAEWCGGWALDDLPWSEHMLCYRRREDDPAVMEMSGGYEIPLAGSMFPGWGDEPTPGGVMLAYGVPVLPGQWVVKSEGNFRGVSDNVMRKVYRLTDNSAPAPIYVLRKPPAYDRNSDDPIRTSNITPGAIFLACDPENYDDSGVDFTLTNYYSGSYQAPGGIFNHENRLEITVRNEDETGQVIDLPITKRELLRIAEAFMTAALDEKNW